MANAIGTCCPRIMSITGFAFRGATLTNLRTALASAIVPIRSSRRSAN